MRAVNARRKRVGRTVPRPPRELVRALRVSIDDLRPWEYDGMSAWEYDETLALQQAWREYQRLFPPGHDTQAAPRPG